MERKRRQLTNDSLPRQLSPELMNTYSAILNRASLAGRMGVMTYSGDRDVYQALGYPKVLNFKQHYLPKYVRHDIAKAIIDRPVHAAWRGGLSIRKKDSKGKANELQTAWEALEKKHKIQSMLTRVDKLTGIGRYGVLLLGLNDVTDAQDLATPVLSKSNKLLYIKPLSEGSADVVAWEDNAASERFGKPVMYNVSISNENGSSLTMNVHYTRLIHITDDVLEDESYGTPRLEAVFNRLLDLDKIVGGDGEMFWRGARPGYHGKVDKDFQITPKGEQGIQDQFDEFENNLRRFLLLEGVEVKDMAQQISDPSNHVDIQIQMISAVTGIPKRILMGSERGELSSAQDREEWNLWVQTRREEFMEPQIVRPVVDRFLELGILPKTSDYIIHWDELFAMSPKEKAEIAQMTANAIRYYTATPTAEYIVPKEIFLRKLLGFTTEELAEAERLIDALPELEVPLTPQEQAALGKQPVGSPMNGKKVNGKDPMNGTGNDTVAKKQKA